MSDAVDEVQMLQYPVRVEMKIQRWLRRRRVNFIVLVGCVLLVIFWYNVFFSKLQDTIESCPYPCILPRFFQNTPTVRPLDLYEVLNLKKAKKFKHNGQINSFLTDSNEQVCQRPNFDLKHDSVSYAFFSMEKLNCTEKSLFSIENGLFKLNRSLLSSERHLEKCVYFGIERVSDDYQAYTEPVIQETEPFDLIIKQDFVRIKCFYKEKDDKKEPAEEKTFQSLRRLLSVSVSDYKSGVKFDRKKSAQENGLKNIHTFHQPVLRSSNSTSIKENENKLINTFQIRHLQSAVDESNGDVVNDKTQDQMELNEGEEEMFKSSHEMMDYEHYNSLMDDFLEYNSHEAEADFDQFLVQIHPKPQVFKRIKNIKPPPDSTGINVLIFGLDSMSHLSYQRKLPLTYKYLTNNLDAVVLDGYNIVGDATTAALIPILTGKTEMELPDVRKSNFESEKVDVYPLIWKDFSRQGYVTLLAEDEPSIGAFNLRLSGFHHQPTDHYMRPFWQAIWDSDLRRNSPRFCTGGRPNHMFMIDYVRDFMVKYRNVSKFAFAFGSELTHWDNNPGEYADQDLLEFLKFLKADGHLDNTLLVLMADHGARYSRVRKTVQGKMEERLPMMSFVFPPWFVSKFPHLHRNLRENAQRLTTPFDVHETVRDVLDISRTLKQPTGGKVRGRSLLLPVPKNRTCSEAGIDMHWCTCLKQLELDTNTKHVLKSAAALLDNINERTSALRNLCVPLRLRKIYSAVLLVPNEQVLQFQHSKDDDQRVGNFSGNVNIDHIHFQVTIETAPNKGMFEGTIQVNMTANSYTVMDEISRIDIYGNQPACVQEKYPDLRKYCYCKQTGNSG